MPKYKYNCQNCNKEFIAKKRNVKFCCKKCWLKGTNHYREYYQKNKEKMRDRQRKWARIHRIYSSEKKRISGVIKRAFPKNNKCEVCQRIIKFLEYHHWDDNDLKKGKFIKGKIGRAHV